MSFLISFLIFQIVLEEDGTEIPEFELLQSLASTSTVPITVMIIDENSTWEPIPTKNLARIPINNTNEEGSSNSICI